MSSEFFTRADWRPGKKRTRILRTKPYGGRKTAPAAFIEAGKRTRFTKGRPGKQVCTATKRNGRPCGMLAFARHGLTVCGAHGGFLILAKRGVLRRTGKHAAIVAEARAAAVTDTGGATTSDSALLRLPVYREASANDRVRLAHAFETAAWPATVRDILDRQRP